MKGKFYHRGDDGYEEKPRLDRNDKLNLNYEGEKNEHLY